MRRSMRALRRAPEDTAGESRALCAKLMEWLVYRHAQCLAAYMPLPYEADITPVLRRALAEGKRLLLPAVEGREMRFYDVADLNALAAGTYGVREPGQDAREASLKEAELVLVPLEAVDGCGRRLGKGGGYYDRALRGRGGFALGVALSHQVVERVPTADWDERLDGWVDPMGIHIITEAR